MKTFDNIDKHDGTLCEVFIENEQDKIPFDDEMKSLLVKTVAESVRHSGIDIACEVSITIVDDSRIREINKEFRNKDAATDVLSFPLVEMEEGVILSTEGDIDRDENRLLLGDIVVSFERAKIQAEDYGHSISREIAFLTTHGVFHLLGYDHMTKLQEKKMLAKQEEVLAMLGLARK